MMLLLEALCCLLGVAALVAVNAAVAGDHGGLRVIFEVIDVVDAVV